MKSIIYLLLMTFSLISCNAQEKETRVKLVSPVEFAVQMNKEEGQVIDVRTPKEFNSGHIDGAVSLHVYDQNFDQRIDKLDKDKPVYVYCKVGGRSAEAVETLTAKGFKEIIELDGGMDAWLEAGKPVQKQ